MSVRMGHSEIGKYCVPVGIGGGVDALYESVPEGKHLSDPILSSNFLVGLGQGEHEALPFWNAHTS